MSVRRSVGAHSPFSRPSLFGLLLLLSRAATMPAAQPARLTVERLVSLPYLSGTEPTQPVWSPDSTKLAFLWNDQGMPFRDIWTVAAAGGEPRPITRLEHRGASSASHPDLAGETELQMRAGVADLVWTPDGQSLVFSFEGDLFKMQADGTRLEQLTRSPAARNALAFSPDGRYLSFLQEGDLWLWNWATHDLVQATRFGKPPIGNAPPNTCCGPGFSRPDVEFSSYLWSPGGRHIALHLDDRRSVRRVLIPNYLGEETVVNPARRDYPGDNDHIRDIGVYSVEDGRVKMLGLEDATDRSISSYGWSPDGSHLLIDHYDQSAENRWIYICSPEDGALRQVWHDRRETRTTQYWNSVWRSDGRGILFVSDKDGRHRLYRLDLGGVETTQLTHGEWSVIDIASRSPLIVSPTTRQIYFVANRKNPYERHVYRLPEEGGEVQQVTSLAGTHTPCLSPDGSRIALLHSSDSSPTELYIAESRGGNPERRITHSPPKDFYEYPWVKPRYVTFLSHVDGVTLHGRLLEPPNLDRARKYPVILGPVYPNSVRNRWADRQEWRGYYSSLQQYLVLEGESISFLVDVRGSVGYGRDFREKLLRDYGGIDIDDLESGVRYLKTLPYVDPDRIGIWGSSYGGLMTVMSLFKKPGLYKAGVACAPATNVRHAMTGQVNVAGRPNTHPDVYRRVSAISYGEDLRDHLLLMHGMQDSIVLFKDSVSLAEKLMLLGKDFDFAVAPYAVHEWSTRDYVARYFLTKLVDHFDRYLGRGPR